MHLLFYYLQFSFCKHRKAFVHILLHLNGFSSAIARKSLVHELNECVSSRVLKLEKENRELQASIERLKEDNHLLQEQQLHSQELDRENQSLSKKVKELSIILWSYNFC